MLTMITALHATTREVGDLAAVDDLTVRDRSTLEAVLANPDTPQSAAPARDLWMTVSIDTYASLTGRQVPAEQLEFYRLRWDLNDLCVSARWLTEPHQPTADTKLAWQGSVTICHRLAACRP
jgi:hypothetical protein